MEKELLLNLGLTEREIKVYLALLVLGSTTTGPLSKRSEIPNCKIYETLDKLIEKGLVSFILKSSVKYFQPSSPDALLDFVKEKEKVAEEAIAELKQKYNTVEKSQTAEVYEGIKGVNAAFDKMLDSVGDKGEYFVLGFNTVLGQDDVKKFFYHYHHRRMKRGITARLIFDTKSKKVIEKHHLYTGMHPRYTSIKLPTGIYIYKDSIMTFVWGEKPTAFVINSAENAKGYKEFFEDVWENAKK
ncbi:MAG: helix-turn-helix domain-containing protein [Candidatus ainarchaeum sp.]|nr:helix-turn-helix domain-containing protein [Candidatus ainarchaeum sp.]